MWIARNEDGQLMKFPYKPWRTQEMKWAITLDDGTNDFGEEYTLDSPDDEIDKLTWEDDSLER